MEGAPAPVFIGSSGGGRGARASAAGHWGCKQSLDIHNGLWKFVFFVSSSDTSPSF